MKEHNLKYLKKIIEKIETGESVLIEHDLIDDLEMEVIEDKDEGGFVISYLDLPGCITCGETIESAMDNALDAKKAWLSAVNDEE